MAINFNEIPSPCFVLDEKKLRQNLELLQRVKDEADVNIILAFKSFAMWSVFPIVREYLDGAAASSLNEIKLCYEEFGTKAHTYAPAYVMADFEETVKLSSHITFNSITQYELYKSQISTFGGGIGVSCGLRINPGFSDVSTALYNPASPTSRLGIGISDIPEKLPDGIDGLHFHVLCESDSFALEKVLQALEKHFGHLLSAAKWINMGGGHLITRKDYDVDHLIHLLQNFREKYRVEVILEPGSAIAWETGDLLATVLDIVENGGKKTAMLDVSFTCHMPDTLEMPYKPHVLGASTTPVHGEYPYQLGGNSCLAGDFMSEYGFQNPLVVGDQIVLKDMMHYTMVKTSFFNGVNHPSIGIWDINNKFKLVRHFSYQDYKSKLS